MFFFVWWTQFRNNRCSFETTWADPKVPCREGCCKGSLWTMNCLERVLWKKKTYNQFVCPKEKRGKMEKTMGMEMNGTYGGNMGKGWIMGKYVENMGKYEGKWTKPNAFCGRECLLTRWAFLWRVALARRMSHWASLFGGIVSRCLRFCYQMFDKEGFFVFQAFETPSEAIVKQIQGYVRCCLGLGAHHSSRLFWMFRQLEEVQESSCETWTDWFAKD